MAIKECNQFGRRDDRALADLARRNFAGRNQLVNPRARKVEHVGGLVDAIGQSRDSGVANVEGGSCAAAATLVLGITVSI